MSENRRWLNEPTTADMVAAAAGMAVRAVADITVCCPTCGTRQPIVVEREGYPGDRFVYDEWVACSCCGDPFHVAGSAGYFHLPPDRSGLGGVPPWPAPRGVSPSVKLLILFLLFVVATALTLLVVR